VSYAWEKFRQAVGALDADRPLRGCLERAAIYLGRLDDRHLDQLPPELARDIRAIDTRLTWADGGIAGTLALISDAEAEAIEVLIRQTSARLDVLHSDSDETGSRERT
jgi:hypothetical protein